MDLEAFGNVGGPFEPMKKIYTLENTGNAEIEFSVSATKDFIDLSQESGWLDPGETTDLEVSFNSNANSLPIGLHTAKVTFTNNTNDEGTTTLDATLEIKRGANCQN